MPVGLDDMHTRLERVGRQETMLDGQEGMLAGGVDGLRFGVLLGCLRDCGGLGLDGEVDQVVIVVDPHLLDRLSIYPASFPTKSISQQNPKFSPAKEAKI